MFELKRMVHVLIFVSYRVKNIIRDIIRVQRHDVLVHRGGFVITQSYIAKLRTTHQSRRNVSDADGGAS